MPSAIWYRLLLRGFILLGVTKYSTQSSTYLQVRRYCEEPLCIMDTTGVKPLASTPSDCIERCSKLSLTNRCQAVNIKIKNDTVSCEVFQSQSLNYAVDSQCMAWIRSNLKELLGFPNDCSDILKRDSKAKSGVYSIKLVNTDKIFQVYCDMETDGGGWTVLLRRIDGSQDFNKSWTEYADGFGNICGEFWLGNENMAVMTNAESYNLRIDLGDFSGQYRHAQYENLKIGSSDEYYKLTFKNGSYSGDAGDSLTYHLDMNFTTYDQDNDLLVKSNSSANCGFNCGAGWWYKSCYKVKLTGVYNSTEYRMNVAWDDWLSGNMTYRFAEMKIRPDGF